MPSSEKVLDPDPIRLEEDLEKTVLRLLGVLVDALASKMKGPDRNETNGSDTRHANVILNEFLPPLLGYLQRKDESMVDRRMPVSVTIVKLLQLLPDEQMSQRLTPVLTNVCQVLRSRSQEARDHDIVCRLVGGFVLRATHECNVKPAVVMCPHTRSH